MQNKYNKKDGFTEVRPMFAKGGIEPRYAFVMRTNKSKEWLEEFMSKAVAEMKKDMPFVPEAMLRGTLKDKLGECTHEVHAIVVGQDMATGGFDVYLADGHYYKDSKRDSVNSYVVDGVEHDHEHTNAQCPTEMAKLNALCMQFDPNWKGERAGHIEIECESYEDFVAELNKNATLKEQFLSLYPTTQLEVAMSAAVPSMKVDNRAELVKRFGEKAVKETEARIKDKQKGK